MRRWLRLGAIALVAISAVAAEQTSRRVLAAPDAGGARAPERLSDTGLYAAGRPGVLDEHNQSFSPQYPLWSDGAAKARWVSLPPGSVIDATEVGDWTFPVGTRFWKEFSFNGRKVETRMIWKATDVQWVFASYAWNEAGTEAFLAPEGGVPGVAEIAPGRRHDIPSVNDCLACHGSRRPAPLGFNALQLSTDRDPNAIHGEPLTAQMLTLRTLTEERRLWPARPELVMSPPRIRTANPRTRAALGYFAANCGSCHNRSGETTVQGPSLNYNDVMGDGDAVAASLVGHATDWRVPGMPDGSSVLVNAETLERSAILVRMKSRRPSSQMPPLGSVVRDDEAVDAITHWMATDLVPRHSTALSARRRD